MDRTGMNLHDAKVATDDLVGGTSIELEFDSELAASNFWASAALLGAIMSVEPYRVSKRGVQIAFRLGDGEHPDSIENVDAAIEMPDGSRWGATMLTVREVERILARH